MTSAQIKSYVTEISNLKDQFNALSNQSSEKLKKIIETVQSYQTRMEPLNKNMEQLQILQRNLESCRSKLTQVQEYHRTGRELENTIRQGPTALLNDYLKAMERIKEALAFFQENNSQDVEFSRLTSLYSVGLGSLEREFDGILRQAFRPINDATLIRLMDYKASPSDKDSVDSSVNDGVERLDDVPNDMLNSLRFLVKWMSENQSFINRPQGASQGCLTKYCEYRRELIRVNLIRVRELLRKAENPSTTGAASKPGFLPPNVRGRTKRLPGFVWDINAIRQINETETEELDSEHYAIALGVLVKLMQNERVVLDHLQLTDSPQDSLVLLFTIFKNGSTDVLTEGTTLTRLMHRAQGRAEFHMVMSLLVVLRKFSQISNDLLSALQGIDSVLVDFNQLVLRLLSQSKTTLETYVQFLQQVSEKSSASSTIVPADATIHELTTNALMYLENLLEFADIIGTALSFTEAGPQATNNTLKYLGNTGRNLSYLEHRFGSYLFGALFALMTNLERKSEVYSEEIRRMIFQMNNIQYILKSIYKTNIHRYLLSQDREAIAKFTCVLDERKAFYSRCCASVLHLQPFPESCGTNSMRRRRASQFGSALVSVLSPNLNASHHKHLPSGNSEQSKEILDEQQLTKIDNKEKASIKTLWQDLNNGLNSLTKQHNLISIPDRELRNSLEHQLVRDLVPMYHAFWERSMAVSFTSHREKYIKLSVEEFEVRIRQLFIATSNNGR
ncbi:unnamed protein product [Trichobilharzia szidati]|nr:unnamed protein product [Trichobilharzia szidati]